MDKAEIAQGQDSYERVRLDTICSDFDKLSQTVTISDGDDDLVLCGLAVSDDGGLIVVVGQKNNLGWIAVVSVEQKKLLWQQMPESTELTEVVFSPDGNVVYTGGDDRCVYGFGAAAGTLLYKWQTAEYRTSDNEPLRITSIAASPDGRLVAAGVEPSTTAWIWDTKSKENPQVINTGNKYTFGVAFSPDSSLLATSEIRADQKIKVWKMPKNRL